ncbi:MAG TPA: alpha/beta fold hydrolase [Burkholderiales bacterium]
MPVLSKGPLRIDYTDDGAGDPVVLVHSSVSSNRQWRALTEALKDAYRVLAVNLYGYGQTTPWPGTTPQPLHAQAELVLALCEELRRPVHLVGHSFGGLVALKAAMRAGPRIASLVLFEPNPAHLLKQAGRIAAYLDARALFDHVRTAGALGDWPRVAEYFADYWLGAGAWSAMPERRRAAFVQSIPPVIHECDAVMGEETTIAECAAVTARTLVLSDAATRPSIREIVALLAAACPHWAFRTVSAGGHTAPLARPDVVNPIIREFLDAAAREEEKVQQVA